MTCPITADRDEFRATHLRGALAAIIADPDCCAASKAIARGALREEALTELVQLGQEAGDYGEPPCQPQDTQQWTKAELEAWCLGWCRTPHTTLKAFIDAGFCSDEAPSREEMRLLRQPDTSTDDTTKPVMCRPAEPTDGKRLWYRGWECAYDREAASWGLEGWYACLGGEDLDCIVVRGRTWVELLDEIDDHDKTEPARAHTATDAGGE